MMNMYRVVILLICHSLQSSSQDVLSKPPLYPDGDPRNCQVKSSTHRMEVLPGIGWDNLENLDKSQVLSTNYSRCQTTADGKYLLPDHVFVVPIKRSKVDMFSEMYDHWSDYKSSTASSINVGVDFFSKVSGSFSADFQYNKERQVNDKSFTTRVAVRHLLYTVKSQPDAALSKPFLNRLMEIASNIQNNKTDLARYNAQLLIRDFGTHFTTSVDAGAALVKEDHIKETFLKDTTKSSSDIKAAASASFFGKIGLHLSAESKSSQEYLDQYTGNQTTSRIVTHGGPPFGGNFTVNDWENGISNELVPINRNGDLLYYAISHATLPGLPSPTVGHLAKLVEEAITLYYKVNTIPGCTDRSSKNFYFQANIDDGTCRQPMTNFTFGGVFQKCYATYTQAGNLCNKLQQKNPLTGAFSCPKGYKEVLLIRPGGRRPKISTSYHKTQCQRSCHSCGFLWLNKCCKNTCNNVLYYSEATYDTYWCAAVGEVPQNTGYLFGGVFSTENPNPVTGTQKCPTRFYPRALGGHAFVCISDDYELGYQYSLKFAGFFSCSAGNPLAIPKKTGNNTALEDSNGLESFLARGDGANGGGTFYGPKHCPHGYSQHLVTVDNQCEINYCIKANSFDDQKLKPVKRMPFSPRPGINPNTTEVIVVIGVNGQAWFKNATTGDWEQQGFEKATASKVVPGSPASKASRHMSNGATAAISVCVTTLIGILIVIVFVGCRKHRENKRSKGKGLLDSYVDSARRPLNPSEEES